MLNILKRRFSTLVECGIPYMRSLKHIPIKSVNTNNDSESDFTEYGAPYMREIPNYEYKKIFKKHEKKLYNATKSFSSD